MSNEAPDATSLALIEEQADARIRRVWVDDRWYFSVIDVIGLLTDSRAPAKYWSAMKARIASEGFSELSTNCRRLKMTAADGKQRETEAADIETMLRIIQSIPSPKAEPVKRLPHAPLPLWRRGRERGQEPRSARTVSTNDCVVV